MLFIEGMFREIGNKGIRIGIVVVLGSFGGCFVL